jgi:hypothetical protein
MRERLVKLALLSLAVALVAFAALNTMDAARSTLQYRASKAQYDCLDQHPFNRHSTQAELAAIEACFKLPVPAPSVWFWVGRSLPLLSPSIILLMLLLLPWRIRGVGRARTS